METDAGGGGIEKEDMEEGKEEVGRRLMEMKDQEVHLQHPISENFPGSSAPVLESGDQMSALQLCEGLRRSAADINSLWVKLQTSRGGHKVRPVKYTDWEEMGRILQDQKDSLSQMNEEEKATASRISNQWDLWKHDPLSANQQLRKVNEAPWEVQASPWDPQARDWLERECVRQMERNEERLGALAGQNTEVCTGEACALFTTIRELGT
ncbi:hypothetical protein JZ751_008592 [Albula glossodonta]|uniref:Uncharacterized protein n=1 Tax=Albula glossodonta TaxID=121402 RepID=A0A8T2P7D1_9TELE|nr:hypothetical protein JZ751_008592 [Albula glossodonta]